MNAKPVEAIERMKAWLESKDFYELCQNYRHASDIKPHREGADTAAGAFERIKREIAGYLPDTCVCVEWPADLTRERLLELASFTGQSGAHEAIRALAAIAPVRKKLVVNLWKHCRVDMPEAFAVDYDPNGGPCDEPDASWRKVAGPIELED